MTREWKRRSSIAPSFQQQPCYVPLLPTVATLPPNLKLQHIPLTYHGLVAAVLPPSAEKGFKEAILSRLFTTHSVDSIEGDTTQRPSPFDVQVLPKPCDSPAQPHVDLTRKSGVPSDCPSTITGCTPAMLWRVTGGTKYGVPCTRGWRNCATTQARKHNKDPH